MRDDLPPFVRFVFGVGSFAMAATGMVMWLVGWLIELSNGLFLVTYRSFPDTGLAWWIGGFLISGMGLQAIGSAMYFFSQTLIEHKPQNVPTELLPRWWLARFMVPLCVQLAIISLIGVLSSASQRDPILVLWAFSLWAGIQGFRHFRMKTIQLSPPYPPRSGPPKWETRG